MAEHLPELVREVGGEGSEQEDEVALHVGHQLGGRGRFAFLDGVFVSIELVDQLHDGGDGGVEVPASAEVVGDALDGLMELALDLARGRGEGAVVRKKLQVPRLRPIRLWQSGLRPG